MQGFENLLPRIARLAELKPLGISVTWGAGGTTRERSLELAGLTQLEYGLDTILHLTCTNMEKGMVDDALKVGYSLLYAHYRSSYHNRGTFFQNAKARGIQNLLALRGGTSCLILAPDRPPL